MARQKYRANTLAAHFPLLSSFCGKTIIMPQIDQYYVRQNLFSGTEADQKIGIPQVLFIENVMPMANGLTSVGFTEVVPFFEENLRTFDQAFWLRDAVEKRTLFVPAHGRNYLFDATAGTWSSQYIPTSLDSVCSVASIKGRTFICYSKHPRFYEWLSSALTGVTLSGLNSAHVLGITVANAYLIAYTEDTIYWSSILDPTDFVPSLATTAGSSQVLALKGNIVCCTPVADGFYIFTTSNVILASYTGNERFPWTFKEIAGSPGIDDTEKVTKDTSAVYQFVNTVSGLNQVDRNQAVAVFPEINEFLNCKRYELYDLERKKIVEYNVLRPLVSKIAFIGNRYLVVSYGKDRLQAALVYDSSLRRWGKLRIDHVDCFEFIGHPSSQADTTFAIRYETWEGTYADQTLTYEELGGIYVPGEVGEGQEPYKSLAFLQANGRVVIADFDLTKTDDVGVLIIGKYQLARNRFTDLFEIAADGIGSLTETELAVMPTLDGTSFLPAIVPYRQQLGNAQTRWLLTLTCQSFALRFIGSFDLSTLEMTFTQSGYR